jgi:cytochrome P450
MSPAGEKSGPATLDLGDPAYWSAPHTYLGPAREQHPVALTKTGEHVILRYADVESLAGDPRLISDAQPMLTRQGVHEGPLLEWWQRMLTNTNAPEHTRLRALVSRAFTPRSVERMRPRVREITRELLRDCGPGNVDLLQSFAHVLPIRFMCEWLGVPRELEADVGRWSIELGEGLSEALSPEVRSRAEHAVIELERCAAELLSARRAEPRDDLISALAGAADASDMDFDEADLITLVINLLLG